MESPAFSSRLAVRIKGPESPSVCKQYIPSSLQEPFFSPLDDETLHMKSGLHYLQGASTDTYPP